ncbi:retrovirus-related pol polyprotein from transposon TNT 1-94 [Tanacetum coccineum]
MVRHNQTGETVSYDMLYDSLVQFKPHVLASKAKKADKNHDPLALIAYSNASSSQSHAHSSYSSQPYYVTHPSSIVDYKDEYQGKLQGDSQEDKLTTAMMLLARAITQNFSTPTNNRYGGNGNKNVGSQSRNQAFNVGNGINDNNQISQTESTLGKANVQCYNGNEKGHYASDCQKPRVHDAKYFREQMLLAMKDEAGSNLNNKENDFMLDTSYSEETMKELSVVVMLMARIQPADGNAETMPSYDAKAVSEVNASSKVHEQMRYEKRKTIIQTSDDDQIDSNIIFDDPYVENNGGTSDHDSNDHDEYHKIQMLAYDVQREAENQKQFYNELKKQKMLPQEELETSKKAFKERENRYLENICDLEEKLSSHDRIVYKMGKSIRTIHRLGKTPNKVYDPFLKTGLGYKNPKRLKKAIGAQQKMYDGEKLHNVNLKIDSPDSEETLEDVKESRLKMRNKMKVDGKSSKENILQNEIDQLLKISLTSEILDCVLLSVEKQKNELLKDELAKSSSDSKDIQANLLKRIKILKNDFKRSQAQSIDFELKLQHQKEKMVCDVSWKSKLSTLNDENVNTRTLLNKELDELIEHVNQKTYAYADVRAQNQDLLITIYELKNKLKTIDKGKNVNTTLTNLRPQEHFFVNSNVKRALFTTPVAAKSKNLRATSVVAKSRLSVANTPKATNKVIQLVLWIVDSGCSKHMTGNLQLLRNFVEKFMGTVRFGNDHFAAITGYGDYVQVNLMICHVYYVEGLRHNLFLVEQFCDGDLEVAFRSNTCYVWNLEGNDLLTGSRDSNLYTIYISEIASSSPVCLMSRATSTKSWLWHRRLSHLNFGTINQLTSKDLVDGLPKFKYNKDHLCSAYEQGKSKKASLPP